MNRCPSLLATGLVLAAVCGGAVPSAQGPVTFQSGIDLIQLDVVVLDSSRRPVSGLTAADFSVRLDGKAAPIEVFAPITLPEANPSDVASGFDEPADVTSNQRAEDGRLVVVMVDRSVPPGQPTIAARSIARAVVENLGPADLGAVVRSSVLAGEGIEQGLTTNRGRLLAAVEASFIGANEPAGTAASGPFGPSGECQCGYCVLESIERLADTLASETRRQKAIVFVGARLDIESDRVCVERPYYREKMLRALDRANVTVHSIDPMGLETLASTASQARPAAGVAPRNLARQGSLAVLPDFTGGRTIVGTNDPERHVSAIFGETRSYYLVGIRRPEDPGDRRREIEVRVNRDDVSVRTRRAYFPPRVVTNTASVDRLAETIKPLLPETGLPLSVALTPTFLPDGTQVVGTLVGFDRATSPGAGGPATVDVIVGVFDRAARPVSTSRQTVEIVTPRPDGRFEWLVYFPAKPGSYEVRIGAVDRVTGQGGSVYGFVDVPDVSAVPFTVSGLRLERSAAVATASTAGRVQPTLTREFATTDRVVGSLMLRRRADAGQAVTVRLRISGAQGEPVIDRSDVLGSSAFAASGVAAFRADLPMSNLGAGQYLLIVDVESDGRTQSRQTRFAVR